MTVAKQSTFQLLGVRGVQIGIALFVLQQFAGINAVMYFSTQVFKEVGTAEVFAALMDSSKTAHVTLRAAKWIDSHY